LVERRRETEMPANIYLYCPAGKGDLARSDLEEKLEAFFGEAAEVCGAGIGATEFNLDYELADGEDPHVWADRLKTFLASIDVRPGSKFDVFPDGWEPGMEWREVEVFGEDRRRMDRPGPASPI
jgi:hypothetical protein